MKTLGKWLLKPFVQRFVYAILLLLCLHISHSNGSMNRINSFTSQAAFSLLLVLLPMVLLGAQVIWNRKWLWMCLCGYALFFTLWLATLSLSQIIAGAGAPAKSLIWGVGAIGFTVVLVLVVAFLNWTLLHMKPKK